jgi:hypothetical protein
MSQAIMASDRMSEGRQFCLAGIHPVDYLEQHGVFCLDDVRIHLGKLGEADNGKGTRLGSLNEESLLFWIEHYKPEKYHGTWIEEDIMLDAALCCAQRELDVDGRVY